MVRNIAIVFCVLLFTSESFAALEFIREIITRKDQNITRVNTEEELEKRAGENVVLGFIGHVQRHAGYTAEEYDVQTEDGYILKLHRLSGSPSSPKAPGKPVVYVAHCLLCSSDLYVMLGPEQAFAFHLADLGYDVWFGNIRGNTYSKRHIKYSSAGSNEEFWDFSMHEPATIDLPAFIDTVLEKTNQTQLTYIGFSMGCTMSYILLSTKPEYNDKIKLIVNMAPPVYFSSPHSTFLDTLIIPAEPARALARVAHVYQILPQSKLLEIVGKDVCNGTFGEFLCEEFFSSLTNRKNLNDTELATLIAYFPAGASLYTIFHYYQLIKTENFTAYDYGILKNLRKYGSSSPPSYNISQSRVKTVLFYADGDVFDAELLKNAVPNVVGFEKVPSQDFRHMDFLWATDAYQLIYEQLIYYVKQYS